MPAKKDRKRKGRRAKGSGSVFFHDGRGVWVGRKIVGRTAAGKPLYVQVSDRTQAGAVEKLNDAGPPGKDTTVAGWAARWLKSIDVRPATLANYRNSLDKHILPVLGGLKVRDVTPDRVGALLVALKKDGLEPGTVAKVRDHGRTMFKAAVLSGAAERNPFGDVRRPKVDRKKIDPYSAAELARVVAEASAYPAGRLVALLAGVGCRLGEASALQVADFDPAAGKLSITKTYSKIFGVGPPKSKHSLRTITVPPSVRPLLVAAAGGRKDGYLFLTGKRKPYLKALVQRGFARMLRRVGLPVKSLHQLRHGVATHLISVGCPIGDVARFLGDTEATVVNTYLHATGRDPAEDMERAVGQGGGKGS